MGAPRPRIAVLYDCVHPWVPGGGQKRLFEVCRRLVARGWQVDWYGLQSWPGKGELVHEGVRFVPVAPAVPLYGPGGKRPIGQTLYYGRAIARFPRLRGYDVVHMGQWPYFHFFPVRLFSWFGRARISADWWEVWGPHWMEYYGTKGWLGMLLERVCARIPARLIAISDTGARDLAGIGVAADRLRVIHNGIDFRRIRGTLPANEGFDLVYLGRLQPHKNVDLLVQAVALLRGRGRVVSLAVIGDGPERATLEARVCELGIGGQVRFLGAIESDDEVYARLRAARVFVHPSTKEGGGSITSFEANAAGLPVVAFAHPGGLSPELITDGDNGIWVQQFGASGLAGGIERALGLAADADMPDRCAAFAGRFDWDRLTDQYEQTFAELLGLRPGRPAAMGDGRSP